MTLSTQWIQEVDALASLEGFYWAGGEDKGSGPILYSPKVSVKRPLLLQRTQLAKAKCTVTSLLWAVAPGSFFHSDTPLSSC